MNDILKNYVYFEKQRLSPYAVLSDDSRGRLLSDPSDADDIRTPFMRDRDRIIHSKSFRRLMHKTQCFLSPEGDHYRTRLTHTLEVSQIARTVARALALNEDLTEAAALGHDLGHGTPLPFLLSAVVLLSRRCGGSVHSFGKNGRGRQPRPA